MSNVNASESNPMLQHEMLYVRGQFEGNSECDTTSVLRGLRGACVRRFCPDPEKGQRQMGKEQVPQQRGAVSLPV